ncbi:MAG: TetR/AcrR family transcriptional regulator [bacterium]|nr:TetR/AcrR family transcriptional regulator [bacterium]
MPRSPLAMPAAAGHRPDGLKRRQLQMLETRDLLIETGLREFARDGLDIPSIRGICASAGLTRGAFYTHFKDRDEFFVAVMERALGKMTQELPRRGVLHDSLGETLDVAQGILAELSRRAATRRKRKPGSGLRFHSLLAAADRSAPVRSHLRTSLQEVRQRLVEIIETAQASGRSRTDLAAADLADHIVTHALGALAHTSAGIPVDAERTVQVLRAFIAPPSSVACTPKSKRS